MSILDKCASYTTPLEVQAMGIYPYFTPTQETTATEARIDGEWKIKHPGLRPFYDQAKLMMKKFDRVSPAGVSAATRISGVRAFAASVRPVIAFVNPGPWWTETQPSCPLTRA